MKALKRVLSGNCVIWQGNLAVVVDTKYTHVTKGAGHTPVQRCSMNSPRVSRRYQPTENMELLCVVFDYSNPQSS